MRKQSGFTLIELLIVLAILGILVGIVTMSVSNLQATALARGKAAHDKRREIKDREARREIARIQRPY